jgi:hypothetical protein
MRVNGVPLHLVEPEPLRAKVLEPVLLLGADRFNKLDVRVRVRGGGFSSQVYGELRCEGGSAGGHRDCSVCPRSHPSGHRQGPGVLLPKV